MGKFKCKGHRCQLSHLGQDVECVNGVAIDIDVFTSGWSRDTLQTLAPCHPHYCSNCWGTGSISEDGDTVEDCPKCDGIGATNGVNNSLELLEEAGTQND